MIRLRFIVLPVFCMLVMGFAFADQPAGGTIDIEKLTQAIRDAGLIETADEGTGKDWQTKADQAGFEKAVEKLRSTEISVNFENTLLEDVLAELQTLSDVNILLDPKVQAERGEVTVYLRLKDVKPMSVLQNILKMHDLIAVYGDEAFMVSLPAQEPAITIVYDAVELTMVRDFAYSGPRLLRRIETRRPRPWESGWSTVGDDEEVKEEEPARPDRLIQILKAATPNGDWDNESYAITHDNGMLIITQRPEIQLKLAQLLLALKTR